MGSHDNVEHLAQLIRVDLANISSQPKLIGVDGNDGVGKTPLAKALGSFLSADVVSLDKFLSEEKSGVYVPALRIEPIKECLRSGRLIKLIDGVCLLSAAKRCDFKLDKLIYVKKISAYGHWYDEDELYPSTDQNFATNSLSELRKEIRLYHAQFAPDKKANYEFHWNESL